MTGVEGHEPQESAFWLLGRRLLRGVPLACQCFSEMALAVSVG